MASFAAAAAHEVGQAYRPAFKQINRQEKRVRNLDRKQARDEKAYRNWLATTQRSIQAANAQQSAQLAGVEQGFHQQLVGQLGASASDQAQRAANIGGPPGVGVSDPVVQGHTASATAASSALGAGNVAHIASGGEMLSSVSANNLAFVAAQSAKRKAATMDAISKLAAARGDLATKRAADTAKRAADMQAAAADQAWKQMEFEAKLAYQQAQLDQGQQRINATVASQANTALNQRVNRRLARQRIGISKAAGRRAAKGGGLNAKQIAAADNEINAAVALARGDKVHAGPYIHPGSGLQLVRHLVSRGYKQDIAEVAAFKLIYPGAPLTKRLKAVLAQARNRQSR